MRALALIAVCCSGCLDFSGRGACDESTGIDCVVPDAGPECRGSVVAGAATVVSRRAGPDWVIAHGDAGEVKAQVVFANGDAAADRLVLAGFGPVSASPDAGWMIELFGAASGVRVVGFTVAGVQQPVSQSWSGPLLRVPAEGFMPGGPPADLEIVIEVAPSLREGAHLTVSEAVLVVHEAGASAAQQLRLPARTATTSRAVRTGWSHPERAQELADAQYATAAFPDAGGFSEQLVATDFLVPPLPPNSHVTGLTLTVWRSALGTVRDTVVRLRARGVEGFNQIETTASPAWNPNERGDVFGGLNDVWQVRDLDESVLRDTDGGFGFVIAAQAAEGEASAFINSIELTVHHDCTTTR